MRPLLVFVRLTAKQFAARSRFRFIIFIFKIIYLLFVQNFVKLFYHIAYDFV